jgi:ABC-type tungstate transport system substrate-binding protein
MFEIWAVIFWTMLFVYMSAAIFSTVSMVFAVRFHNKEEHEKWLLRVIISCATVFILYGLFKYLFIG